MPDMSRVWIFGGVLVADYTCTEGDYTCTLDRRTNESEEGKDGVGLKQ